MYDNHMSHVQGVLSRICIDEIKPMIHSKHTFYTFG